MAGETTAPHAAPAQTPEPETQPQGQQPTHHSQRQPRDDAKRFAGPPAQGAPEAQPQTPASRRKFVFVEEGKEVVEELDDAEIEQRIRAERNRRYLDKTATQKLQRAGEMTKKAQTSEEVAQALATGDAKKIKAYFAQQKKDPKEALATVLEAILAEDDLTPEQQELAAANAKIAAMEEERRREMEEREVGAFQARMDQIRPEVEKVWGHALNQEGLPKTEQMLETAASIFLTALEAGQRLSPEQVAELTRLELVEAQKGLVESMDPAHLFQHFPGALQKLDENLSPEEFEQRLPRLAKRYWAYLAAKVRGTARRPGQQPQPTPTPRQPTKTEEGGGVLDPYLAGKLRAR
jgi:hypothetical protein